MIIKIHKIIFFIIDEYKNKLEIYCKDCREIVDQFEILEDF